MSYRIDWLQGSSPLTRGKRVCDTPCLCRIGLIPAHAGKTRLFPLVVAHLWAHPRSRGENICTPALRIIGRGSSPLTRGKLDLEGVRRGGRGLIPAHAGKTPPRAGKAHTSWAHPRSRGENQRVGIWAFTSAGSSPLTRGKRRRGCRAWLRRGLIPAHAGKTTWPGTTRPHPRAHPRSRGENTARTGPLAAVRGSSPLTRGKLLAARDDAVIHRLIPAHAGKTE